MKIEVLKLDETYIKFYDDFFEDYGSRADNVKFLDNMLNFVIDSGLFVK